MKGNPPRDPRFLAGVKLLERTGARSFRIGHSDEDDGDPVIWHATATWGLNPTTGRPMPRGGRISHEVAAALNPVDAVMRLCEQVIDGGECAHCHRPTAFTPDTDTAVLDLIGCVYAWDPELATFRRDCEGDAA